MSSEYPLADFLRDFHTVTALAETEEEAVFERSMLHLRNYMQQTYQEDLVRTRRGMALGFTLNFLSEHHRQFDTTDLAVVGRKETLVSLRLLNALHAVVIRWALKPKGSGPTPEAVRNHALAHPSG
jgi:hypothetical protein